LEGVLEFGPPSGEVEAVKKQKEEPELPEEEGS
jgi:hypothetical protein